MYSSAAEDTLRMVYDIQFEFPNGHNEMLGRMVWIGYRDAPATTSLVHAWAGAAWSHSEL